MSASSLDPERRDAEQMVLDDISRLVSDYNERALTSVDLYERLLAITAKATILLPDNEQLSHMRGDQLRAHLSTYGISAQGRKTELVERVLQARLTLMKRSTVHANIVDKTPVGFASADAEIPGIAPLQVALSALVAQGVPRKGPQTGIFTDGSCSPNPGPGGWGVVAVRDGEVLWTKRGSEVQTTNNRMELQAIIAALMHISEEEEAVIYSDSNLCVQTLTDWAVKWERQNWTRGKGQRVNNLDLVQEAFYLAQARPNTRFHWIRVHDGSTWNEYADRLASWRE